jgi:hypothetical protein
MTQVQEESCMRSGIRILFNEIQRTKVRLQDPDVSDAERRHLITQRKNLQGALGRFREAEVITRTLEKQWLDLAHKE